MDKQKYIIAGGGCSGLLVALQLAQNTTQETQILIIDREKKSANDRTWCFWAVDPPCPRHIVHHAWSTLSFADHRGVVSQSVAPYTYYMVRSADWYAYMWAELDKYAHVSFLKQDILDIGEDALGPYVHTIEGRHRGDYVLNSVAPGKPQPSKWPTYRLWQHFVGWWIEADQDIFDPQDARLMDFGVKQHGDSRFMYVLPYSSRKALVEFTVFSEHLLSTDDYQQEIKQYLKTHFPDVAYTVVEEEQGKIPMTNQKVGRYEYPHVLNIGTIGGAVKPTTGYAFLRIHAQAKQIVQALLQAKRAVDIQLPPTRFAFYDRLLLHILTYRGERGADIFSALFRSNPMRRILTFLNEQSTIGQEVRIFSGLPYGPFLRALGAQLAYRVRQSVHRFPRPRITTSSPALESEHQIIQQELQ